MTVNDLVSSLPLTVVAGHDRLTAPVTGGYVSDLLSNVMGFAAPGNVWVTMQGHQNIVAVASLAGLAAVVVAGGAAPEPETVAKAEAEGVVLLTSPLTSFELVGQLYRSGVKGQ
ncbi:DRTGG domain-containing protein [Anaeroselena agilis]|uniref:DRTGG domain-containing protein n=1 Tax=Anaeroselena agilis TaxID=3063788 RepID=A0ABU3NZS8_9FIRM|nr:DRTGG domain-containing protein [Selenomonadales bacterium 4137-cl]